MGTKKYGHGRKKVFSRVSGNLKFEKATYKVFEEKGINGEQWTMLITIHRYPVTS